MMDNFPSETEPEEIAGVSGGKVWEKEDTSRGHNMFSHLSNLILLPGAYAAVAWTGIVSDFPFSVIIVVGIMCIVTSALHYRPSAYRKFSIKQWLLKLTPIAIISTTMACLLIIGPQIKAEYVASLNHDLTQEYGYSQVLKNNYREGVSLVSLEDGTEKKVGLMFYQGYTIYYENEEQLLEKMHKVDTGKYSEEFKE